MSLDQHYRNRIQAILAELNIPPDYEQQVGLPLQPEATALVDSEPDVFGRVLTMTPHTLERWQAMKQAAAGDGIQLQLVSAFRSVDYQKGILQRKLQRGETLNDILKVNAAPGFSEHHTGCALDITTPGCKPLTEDFETTAAFNWLSRHARQFGFHLSYPKDSPTKIVYEPWHWACL